ncbi:hypothetical protein ACI703_05860 [Isoptericola jiangsuensis]|jgi:hypothetical protein|uniref:hypothetical protein n=1 Tax=Bacteria TaxID=2 RepID=UPI001EF8D2BC|nr:MULTISPECIES: hypothetical protein [Stenotrophomonas]
MTPSDLTDDCTCDITDAADEIERHPDRMMALLRKISAAAAVDGFPWPEGYLLPGGHLGLTDADRTLVGLRVVQEIMLAAERSRHHDDAAEYVGDHVMDGLMQACIALSEHAASRIGLQ